jgi:hypothetical protein
MAPTDKPLALVLGLCFLMMVARCSMTREEERDFMERREVQERW